MKLEKLSGTELAILGNIKSIEDYTILRAELTTMLDKGAKDVTIRIPESFSMPSSVIGFLMKIKNRENVRLRLMVGDSRLYELLNDLNLIQEFGVVQWQNQ